MRLQKSHHWRTTLLAELGLCSFKLDNIVLFRTGNGVVYGFAQQLGVAFVRDHGTAVIGL